MCNCITELEKKVMDEQPFKDLKITKATFISAAFFMDGSCQVTGEMECEVEGRKRAVKKSIVYSHCPMCGVKYNP